MQQVKLVSFGGQSLICLDKVLWLIEEYSPAV